MLEWRWNYLWTHERWMNAVDCLTKMSAPDTSIKTPFHERNRAICPYTFLCLFRLALNYYLRMCGRIDSIRRFTSTSKTKNPMLSPLRWRISESTTDSLRNCHSLFKVESCATILLNKSNSYISLTMKTI